MTAAISRAEALVAGPELVERLVGWRRHLHANPELSGAEAGTAAFVGQRLAEMGIPFVAGVGGHGVVGTLTRGSSRSSVGLRADMDALPLSEETNLAYASRRGGLMHACGHDGHTTCLLGGAALLAADRSWSGTVHFIFQPAEEAGTGARAMVADGLMTRFPMDRVFAFHNWPGLAAGTVAVRPGVMTAGTARLEIIVSGHAAHAAAPHRSRDPLLAAAQLIVAIQSIVSREVDPQDSAVVSLCTMEAGTALNQIPDKVVLRGTMRLHRPEMREPLEASLRRICGGIGQAFAVEVVCNIVRGSDPCPNTVQEAAIARDAAILAGLSVDTAPRPSMVGEDFAWMLRERPGALVWIGNGPADGGRELHNPRYDFNDAVLPAGAAWFAAVARLALSEDPSADAADHSFER